MIFYHHDGTSFLVSPILAPLILAALVVVALNAAFVSVVPVVFVVAFVCSPFAVLRHKIRNFYVYHHDAGSALFVSAILAHVIVVALITAFFSVVAFVSFPFAVLRHKSHNLDFLSP